MATPCSGWQPCFAVIESASSMLSTANETRCMPISFGNVGSVSMASGWMYSNSSIRPSPPGVCSTAIFAWFPSSPTAVAAHSPLTVSRPATVRPRSVKNAMASSMSRTVMPTFSNLIAMGSSLWRPGMPTGLHVRPCDQLQVVARGVEEIDATATMLVVDLARA